jgi:hypothetical protein
LVSLPRRQPNLAHPRAKATLLADQEIPMSDQSSSKTDGFLRQLSPRLRDDQGLADYMRVHILPVPPVEPDAVRNASPTMLGSRGIDLQLDQQLARLASWNSSSHQTLFKELQSDPELRLSSNGYFLTPDAEIYASMILDRKPRRIIEVGSGFSTLIARKTIRYAGYPTKLLAIDPRPRTDVKAAVDELLLTTVEQSGLIDFDWAADDVLFIDSSHICRTRGDLPYLFCQVLPSLPAGVLVHVHDIFLPYDYPNIFDPWCYEELYLLHCMLAHTPRYQTVFANHFLSRQHPDQMRAIFGSVVASEEVTNHFGCSYWFEIQN